MTAIDIRTSDNIMEVERVQGQCRVTRSLAVPPVRFVQPHAESDAVWVFVSAFGGGMLEGDDYRFDIKCRETAKLIFSPQANTRIFPCPNGKMTRQSVRGTVYAQGLVVTGGDPVVLYAGSRFSQSQHWTLHPQARLVLMDWLVVGRLDRGERFAFEGYENDLRVENEKGHPLLLDRLSLEPEERGMGGFASHLAVHILGPGWENLKTELDAWLKTPGKEKSQPAWKAAGILAGTGMREETGFSLRALGENRESLEPLVGKLFALLGSAEWLGFDPWLRKY